MSNFMQFYLAYDHESLAVRAFLVFIVVTCLSSALFSISYIEMGIFGAISTRWREFLRVLAAALFIFVGVIPCTVIFYGPTGDALAAFHRLGVLP